MKVTELKKGMFFHTMCYASDFTEYGPLQVISVTTNTTKFCTRWEDWGGYHRPMTDDDYVDRDEITIKYRNEHGKVDSTTYWKDECEKGLFAETRVFPIKADNFEDAHKLWLRDLSANKLKGVHDGLLKYVRSVYGDIFSLTEIVNTPKNRKVQQLCFQLYEELKPKVTTKK